MAEPGAPEENKQVSPPAVQVATEHLLEKFNMASLQKGKIRVGAKNGFNEIDLFHEYVVEGADGKKYTVVVVYPSNSFEVDAIAENADYMRSGTGDARQELVRRIRSRDVAPYRLAVYENPAIPEAKMTTVLDVRGPRFGSLDLDAQQNPYAHYKIDVPSVPAPANPNQNNLPQRLAGANQIIQNLQLTALK